MLWTLRKTTGLDEGDGIRQDLLEDVDDTVSLVIEI
jgi:hypothetical protein